MGTAVILILLALVSSGLILATSARPQGGAPATLAQAAPEARPPAPAATRPLSRDEVAARLRALAASEPPKNLEMGAMCYDMAGPPPTADYVCPKCGQRTQYSREGGLTMLLTYELQGMRAQVKSLKGLDATLDESELCRKCSPSVQTPELVLRVRYTEPSGGKFEEHRVRGVRPRDLTLLQEFLGGTPKHTGEQGRESPLRDHLPRIRELLGVKD
ncbi:MAG TPA: hypothetical protein PK668_06890 [Myxococcota bacterium]|nr:hypothetical protein [Myxococcota bacterium]HRY92430.1 hypothetical protein [Myxococcota bacterium]HSA22767.1 hypothetical protein [Myxococcota bacterium]